MNMALRRLSCAYATFGLLAFALFFASAVSWAGQTQKNEEPHAEGSFVAPLPDERPSTRAFVTGAYVHKIGVTPVHRDAKARFDAAQMICPKIQKRPARLTAGRIEDAGTFYGYEYIGPTYAEYLYINELVPLDLKSCDFQVRLKKIVTFIRPVAGRWEITTYEKNDNQPGDINERVENALLDLTNAGYLPARRKYTPEWLRHVQETGKQDEPFPFISCRVVDVPVQPLGFTSACITDSPKLAAFSRPMVLRLTSQSPDNPDYKFEGRVDELAPLARIDTAVFESPKDLPVKEKRYVARP